MAAMPRIRVDTTQLEQLLQLQRDVLEMVAVGKPTDHILSALCTLAEAMVPNSVASIMQLESDGERLFVRSAPSIPQSGIDALNGLTPGPNAGSCGTAVYTEQPVFVANTLTDARWADYLDAVEQFRLLACWSMPIRTGNDRVIGSFALTSFETRPPDPFQKRLLDTGGYLAGIVLEREHYVEGLVTAAAAFDHMSEAVMVTDGNRRIIQVNRAFETITGYRPDEAIGQTPAMLGSGHQDADFYGRFYQQLHECDEWRGEIWNRRKNGDVYPQWLSVRVVRGGEGEIYRYVAVFADITVIKETERKLWQMAHHDALSDLPNRLMLRDRLEHAVQYAQRHGGRVALLFIDLDRFKTVNDSLGHPIGDALLKLVAQRLSAAIDEADTVARLGGDEFVVLVESTPDAAGALCLAERITQALKPPFPVSGKSIFVTASIGISLYPDDAVSIDRLMQHADAAMYQAKALGRSRVAFYSPDLTQSARRRLALEHDLRRAMDEGQFLLHYQPQFAIADGRLTGVEALVRWAHPDRGLVMPTEFIGAAEETGLIDTLGLWVAETACREAQAWREGSGVDFSLAVNLSPYQLDAGLVERMADIFRQTGFPATRFRFEVTESLFVEEGGSGLALLERMRDHLGISFAMDDFGTGHASLNQLKRLPIGTVKIDRAFIADLPDDDNDAAICRAIVLMAHALGLCVVAEGVETEAQRVFLQACGCDCLQGFLLARPLTATAIADLLCGGELDVSTGS